MVFLGVFVVGGCGSDPAPAVAGDGGGSDAKAVDARTGADGAEAGAGGTGGAAGQGGAQDAALDVAMGTADAQAPDVGGSGGSAAQGGSGGSGGSGGVGGSGGTGGSGADVPGCPQDPGLTYQPCGHQGAYTAMGYSYVSRKKGGLTCATCTYPGTPGTPDRMELGCSVHREVDAPGISAMLVCVSSCLSCCYDQPNEPCESDADCCSPLSCQDNGPGKNKTCK